MHVELKQKERGEKEIRRSVFLYLSLQSTGRTENFLDTQRSGKNEKDKFEISKKRRSHFLTILYFFYNLHRNENNYNIFRQEIVPKLFFC